jgi:hypothetical protein
MSEVNLYKDVLGVHLPDGDYFLEDQSGWFDVGVFTVRMNMTGSGLRIEVYKDGVDSDPVAETFASLDKESDAVI